MTRRKTDGERIAEADGNARLGDLVLLDFPSLVARIDRLIRRRQKEAWDDAIDTMERVRSYPIARAENPYRGRRKK